MGRNRNAVLCREEECETLCRLISGRARTSQRDGPEDPAISLPPAVYLQGPPRSGKRLVLKHVLRRLSLEEPGCCAALTSCRMALLGNSQLFQDILRQLDGDGGRQSSALTSPNFPEFVARLREIAGSRGRDRRLVPLPVVIALTDCEALLQQGGGVCSELLAGFLRLQELCCDSYRGPSAEVQGQGSVCVVLSSRLPFSKLETMASPPCGPPISLRLKTYTKQQLVNLLVAVITEGPEGEAGLWSGGDLCQDEPFVRTFAEVIVGTFHAVCRNLPQFVSVSRMVWPKYVEPVGVKAEAAGAGAVAADNYSALYRNVEPFLKTCLSTANLKENGGSCSGSSFSGSSSRLNVELPLLSKYLLIAAFLASYNPAKTDKRFFVRNNGKAKRVKRSAAAALAHRRSSQLLGPKPFPMDRMLAIFHVVKDVQGAGDRSSEILGQVASLVDLGFLLQVGNEQFSGAAGIDSPKFKCNVGLDFISQLAKNVQFDIHKYFYDAAV